MREHTIGIQARTRSSRLPGKVMYKLGNSNLNSIELMVNRIRADKNLSNVPIYILTSTNSEDDVIEYIAEKQSINCVRGEENDVLSRYAQLAQTFPSENIIRLTADCPLISPQEIVRIIRIHEEKGSDYTTNTFEGSQTPDGFDVEVFKTKAILHSNKLAKLPSEREHVTFHLHNSDLFSCTKSTMQVSQESNRLTLDTSEDYIVISELVNRLTDPLKALSEEIIKAYQEDKNLQSINSHLQKNHGWIKALQEDEEFKRGGSKI